MGKIAFSHSKANILVQLEVFCLLPLCDLFLTDSILLYVVFASTLQVNLMPNLGTTISSLITGLWSSRLVQSSSCKIGHCQNHRQNCWLSFWWTITLNSSRYHSPYIIGFVILNVKCHELPVLEYDKSEELSLIFHLLQFNSTAKQGEKLFQTTEDRFLSALQSFINYILFICMIYIRKTFKIVGSL